MGKVVGKCVGVGVGKCVKMWGSVLGCGSGEK